jgi:hypothetical protein
MKTFSVHQDLESYEFSLYDVTDGGLTLISTIANINSLTNDEIERLKKTESALEYIEHFKKRYHRQ